MTTIIIVIAFLIIGCLVGYLSARNKFQREKEVMQIDFNQKIEMIQKDFEQKNKQMLEGSRTSIKGKISENVALLIPGFQEQFPDLNSSEARFMGGPIDYLFFKGMDEKNIATVVFLEVKSGKHSHLNDVENSLKNVIDDAEKKGANVIWRDYKVPES